MKIVFSTGEVHPRDRLSCWREEASQAYVAHKIRSDAERCFWGTIRAGSLDVLGLALFESGECTVERTERCVRLNADDDLLICLQRARNKTLHQDGRDAVLAVNDMVLVDPRRPFSFSVEAGHSALAIKVPRKELQERIGDVTGLTARTICGQQPAAALTSGVLALLPKYTEALNGQAAEKIARQALDLIALSLAGNADIKNVTLSARKEIALLRLKAAIEGALCDHTIKPIDAATRAGISVRYANSLLAEEHTSLERYIVLRRLQRCYDALVDPAQLRRTVSDIAYSYGFSNMSHFTRRFKEQFGCLPRDCRPK